MQFNYLYIDGILDFKKTQFQFNDINIFLGANNTGKSSVLRILELLQNSLDIYKRDGINLNFEGTKLASIKNINTEDIITFKLPFFVLGATILELQYNNKGKLIVLDFKNNDISIIRMQNSDCNINFEEVVNYLDNVFLPKQQDENKNRFAFMQPNTEREKADKSALILVEEDLKRTKEALKNVWEKGKFLQSSKDDEIDKHWISISSTKTNILKKLNIFLGERGRDFYDFEWNQRRYSHAIVPIFNFISVLEVLSSEAEMSGQEIIPTEYDEYGNVIDEDVKSLNFLKENKDVPLFSQKFKYLLDVIRLSLEKGFLDLIELLNNISYLSAIRFNTISPYIDGSNNGTLNKLSEQFFYVELERKNFVNKWLEKLKLGKIVSKGLQLSEIKENKTHLIDLEIKALIFYKFKNEGIDDTKLFTLNKISTGTLQIIVLLMKISLSNKNSILCIEEPETNLHPRLQTTIADILKDANEKFKINFIVETHNEYMLSRFQNLIAEEKLNAKKLSKQLSINYFQISDSSKPQVTSVSVGDDGYIDYSIIYDSEYYPQGYNLHLSLLNKRRENFIELFEKARKLVDIGRETDEEAIYQKQEIIHQKIDRYLVGQDYSNYISLLNSELEVSDVSSKLSPEVVGLLTSGLFLHNNLANDSSHDFSPTVMQLGKAVENVIITACKNIFTVNFTENRLNRLKSEESWLFTSTKCFRLQKMSSSHAQHLLYSLAAPNTRVKMDDAYYSNFSSIIDLTKLEVSKNKFKDSNLVGKIRDLRNNAAHQSAQISLTESSTNLNRVIEFFKMWIDVIKNDSSTE